MTLNSVINDTIKDIGDKKTNTITQASRSENSFA